MAVLKVVSVFDNAVGSYGRPVVVVALGAAIRSFLDECKNGDSELAKHPDDYALYHLSDFDEEQGTFTPVVPVVRLISGKDGL